jgi:hypothetical protein
MIVNLNIPTLKPALRLQASTLATIAVLIKEFVGGQIETLCEFMETSPIFINKSLLFIS